MTLMTKARMIIPRSYKPFHKQCMAKRISLSVGICYNCKYRPFCLFCHDKLNIKMKDLTETLFKKAKLLIKIER